MASLLAGVGQLSQLAQLWSKSSLSAFVKCSVVSERRSSSFCRSRWILTRSETNFKYEQVVKVDRQKCRIAAEHGRFSRIRQVAQMCTPSNTCFLGPTRVHNPNCISIGSAVFAGFTVVTDGQTDRETDHSTPSVTVGLIYVHSTAVLPEKLAWKQ